MTGFKFLVDSNVIIGLEDAQPVAKSFATLSRKCSEYGVRLFVHGAIYDDVQRDRDVARRIVTLSKLDKFEALRGLAPAAEAALLAEFGPINSENDRSDVRLLAALKARTVDFLITQDAGLHKRADRAALAANVLTVEDALDWLRQTFEPKEVRLPYIVERKAYEIDRADPIFDSLREGYPRFDRWFEKCIAEHRDCWTVEIGDQLAGIVILKTENHAAAQTQYRGPKILKICTFKMKPEFRGEKFGEQLLKKIAWFAQANAYDLVYITAYPDQEFLIELLGYYGFEITGTRADGELILEKPMRRTAPEPTNNKECFEFDRLNYPRFWDGLTATKYCVPIRPDYHRKLFPEIADLAHELPLFPESEFGRSLGQGHSTDRTPGNTIRKVYLCRAKASRLKAGDLLLFYMSKDERLRRSQSITSLGVVEQVSEAKSTADLVRLTAKRSVFDVRELEQWAAASGAPVKVIDFLLVAHLAEPLLLPRLLEWGIFSNRPPQSVAAIPERKYAILRKHLDVGFSL
jgi:ribosomal protein S18 acetylase RimI-like enzyme